MKGFGNRSGASACEGKSRGGAGKLFKQFPMATSCLHRAGSPVLMREQGTEAGSPVLLKRFPLAPLPLDRAGSPVLVRGDELQLGGRLGLMRRAGIVIASGRFGWG